MQEAQAYIPHDRRAAIAAGSTLPDRTAGAALFADISGFTPLTEAILREVGERRGAEELTRQINRIYDAVVGEVRRHGGSVITFSGDAITCWFPNDTGLLAATCGLAIQQQMQQFATVQTPGGSTVQLAVKVAIAAGAARRFLVGDPAIQIMDALAGTTIERMAAAEQQAQRGEVVLTAEIAEQLGAWLTVGERRVSEMGDVLVLNDVTTPPELPSTGTEPIIPSDQIEQWLHRPVYERIALGREDLLAELRPAVVLFVRFRGIDYDANDQAGEQLDRYIRFTQQAINRYGGFLLQLTVGDKGSYIYAAFGAPVAHDDDPQRAVAAALDILALPPDMDFISSTQIGISRGIVYSGAYGSSMRRTYGVLGDEVNLAARLMSKASPQQIIVSSAIADMVDADYHLAPMGNVPIKGKQEPVGIFAVLGRKVARQAALPPRTGQLVGRDSELARLNELLQQARTGNGQVVMLEGVAGIGKSSLTGTFAAQATAQGVRVLSGVCQSINQGIAYTPWRQLLRTMFGLEEIPPLNPDPAIINAQIAHIEQTLRDTNPDWLLRLPLLGDLLALPVPENPTTASLEPRLRQEALFSLVIDLLRSEAHRTPLLLLLEDAHWMDEASTDLVEAVSRVVEHEPLFMLLVQRPPISADQPHFAAIRDLPYLTAMDLGELNDVGIAALVANRLAGAPTPVVTTMIQHRAQGNPFFAEELLTTLREAEMLVQQAGQWDLDQGTMRLLRDAQALIRDPETGAWVINPDSSLTTINLGIPDSVHSMVLARLDRLPEAYKITLKAASVIGQIFEIDILAPSHPLHIGLESLIEQMDLIEKRDFARLELPIPRVAYMFKHHITREVTYGTLLEVQQRALHRAVGDVLEEIRPDAVETLAYHYTRADVRAKSLIYLERAARKTQSEFANETALRYYEQALQLEDRWQWQQGRVEVLHLLGRREEQQQALQALAAATDAPPLEVSYLFGQYYEATASYDQAQIAAEQSLTASRTAHDTGREIRALNLLGLIARRRGNYDQARDWYTQALARFNLFADDDSGATETALQPAIVPVLIQTLQGLAHAQIQQGDYAGAQGYLDQALRWSRRTSNIKGEADTNNRLGLIATSQRQFDQAITFYEQALRLYRVMGDRAGAAAALHNLARTTQQRGDYRASRERFAEVLAVQEAINNRWEMVNVYNELGILHQELGSYAEANEYLRQGLELARRIGDAGGQGYVLVNMGLVARDEGDNLRAITSLEAGLEFARAQSDRYLEAAALCYLATVSRQSNLPETAAEQARAALAIHETLGMDLNAIDDLAAIAGAHLDRRELPQATTYATEVYRRLQACNGEGPEFPQQDYFICYQIMAATGDTATARAALRQANAIIQQRARQIQDEQLRQSYLNIRLHREIAQTLQVLGAAGTS